MFQAASIRTDQNFSRGTGRQIGEALRKQLNCTPKACWLFCAPLDGIEDLLQGISEGVGTDQIVGCTSAGEISNEGLGFNSAVLAGIASDHIDFEIVSIQGLEKNSEEAGRKLAEAFSNTPQCLQIFSDGLTGNGCALLKGIASVWGDRIPVTGGAAGDNDNFIKALQFGNGRIYSDSVCGIAFYGDFRLGMGVRSGWAPIGVSKMVTKAQGKVVYELNGEPALNVYERFLGQHADKLPAIGVEYPLGFISPSAHTDEEDHYVLRATMSVDRKERSIAFAGEIPEGVVVNLTCGDKTSVLGAAETAAQMAQSAIGQATPQIIFCYSCMARKIVLGRRTEEEIERVQAQFDSHVPLIGFYTYGEFCPVGCAAQNYLHNESIALSAIGV